MIRIQKFKKALNMVKNAVGNLIVDRRNTYCHMLWDSVFIDQNGNVFACGIYKPGIFGNIYRNDLYRIWTDSIRLKIFRWMSMNKCLYCFFGCKILSRREKEGVVHSPVSGKYPYRVWILYGERCNLDCIMCWQDHRSKATLDNNTLKNNVDWANVEAIELQGGEILAMKNAKALYLWLTTQMNKKVNLITNGMLINDEWADYLVKGSNWIQISVNAATKETYELLTHKAMFTRVIDNIKKLIYLKHKYNFPVKIIYKYTIVPENIHEIGDAIEFADKLGCDEIAYGYNISAPFILRKKKELREQARSKIFKLINANLKIKIERNRLEQLGLLKPGKANKGIGLKI